MVQILPPETSLGTQLGQALGSGLSSGIQRGSEVGFQRGMLQNAMKGLENIPVETTPGQLAQKIMFATAGIPGAEKYVAPLYESLLQDLASRQKASEEIGQAVQRDQQGVATGLPQTNIAGTALTKEGLQELLGEKYFPNVQNQPPVPSPEGLRPQKPLVPPEPIGPQEEAKMRSKLRTAGITNPAVIDDQIKKVKDFQKDIYSAQKEGFSNIQEYQEARQLRDQAFFQEADIPLGESHGKMTPSEVSIWKELSRQYEELPNSQRFANTEQLYNNLVGNPVIQFEENQRGLPIGSIFRSDEIKTRMEDARTSVQAHLNRIDDRTDLNDNVKGLIKNQLRDQYFNSMGTKDYGVAQAAYAVSNLSPETAKAVPMAPPPKVSGLGGFAETKYLEDPKERDKYVYALANSLVKMKPEDSLILMREKALENNFDDKAFNEALNIAMNSGRLKLSDYQAQERNKLSIPQRLDLDSIMEGKRSLWDYFKGKK